MVLAASLTTGAVAGAAEGGLVGDLDLDGVVGVRDLMRLLLLWDHAFTAADLDGDGVVAFPDLLILIENWS
jgi:hypothetical protein